MRVGCWRKSLTGTRRENKAGWWEGYRLAELDDEDLLDERAALPGFASSNE